MIPLIPLTSTTSATRLFGFGENLWIPPPSLPEIQSRSDKQGAGGTVVGTRCGLYCKLTTIGAKVDLERKGAIHFGFELGRGLLIGISENFFMAEMIPYTVM